MLLLLILTLMIVPFVLGTIIYKIAEGKRANITPVYLVGVLFLFFIAEIVFAIGMKGNISFTITTYIMTFILAIIGIAVVILCRKEWVFLKRPQIKMDIVEIMFVVICILLFFAQAAQIFYYNPVTHQDMTLETVQTTIASDSMFEVNPATGKTMEVGMRLLDKLVILPILYSFFARLFHIAPTTLVYIVMPIWFLVISYMVYSFWAKEFFPDNKKAFWGFMILVQILHLCGDYIFVMPQYMLLHQGFMGNSILTNIWIPFASYVGYCFYKKGITFMGMIQAVLCLIAAISVAGISIGATLIALIFAVFLCMRMIAVIFLKCISLKRRNRM